jgi:alpha-amylase/alpha-mannosidase (GH57 family)
MSHENPVNVVLLWHMHQPLYQNILEKNFFLPWTYLHAIKDYSDMAYALEKNTAARAVVNFTPVLLDQIKEYCAQIEAHIQHGSELGDPLLKALCEKNIEDNDEYKRHILLQCTRANEKNIINRFSEFKHLVSIARNITNKPGTPLYLSEQFFFDLLAWYHLAWMGESVRIENSRLGALMEKGHNYSYEDRILLLEMIHDEMQEIIPRYRKLHHQGRAELSFTPDSHPILPLLFDFQSAVDSKPEALMPESGEYPGGPVRAQAHIQNGLQKFESYFGFRPAGCWPAEGGVCTNTLDAFEKAGLRWTASGGGVLRRSLAKGHQESLCIHHPFKLDGKALNCFFRDDNLSDLIGFTYYGWNEDDAVNNLIHHIQNIRNACNQSPETIIPIILDGENCWEHYRHNGYYFLQKLYKKLTEHPLINLTTFSGYLDQFAQATQLEELLPGSWVYADFSTWIGSADKNRAWDLLCAAKRTFDAVMASDKLSDEEKKLAERQLSICESSDWFWWFGDYNAAESVSDFDRLYRMHLKNLYRSLGEPLPSSLDQPISVGHGNPENDGVMRRSEQH